jgi:hypothetical protein
MLGEDRVGTPSWRWVSSCVIRRMGANGGVAHSLDTVESGRFEAKEKP